MTFGIVESQTTKFSGAYVLFSVLAAALGGEFLERSIMNFGREVLNKKSCKRYFAGFLYGSLYLNGNRGQ